MKLIKEFPSSEPIVSMIHFNDEILIATTKCVYKLKHSNDTLVPIELFEENSK